MPPLFHEAADLVPEATDFSNCLFIVGRRKQQLLLFLYLNDNFALRMSPSKIVKSILCRCKGKNLVDHRDDVFRFCEFAYLS